MFADLAQVTLQAESSPELFLGHRSFQRQRQRPSLSKAQAQWVQEASRAAGLLQLCPTAPETRRLLEPLSLDTGMEMCSPHLGKPLKVRLGIGATRGVLWGARQGKAIQGPVLVLLSAFGGGSVCHLCFKTIPANASPKPQSGWAFTHMQDGVCLFESDRLPAGGADGGGLAICHGDSRLPPSVV